MEEYQWVDPPIWDTLGYLNNNIKYNVSIACLAHIGVLKFVFQGLFSFFYDKLRSVMYHFIMLCLAKHQIL